MLGRVGVRDSGIAGPIEETHVSTHFSDRLAAAIAEKGSPVCVGIDPVFENLPADITETAGLNDPDDSDCVVDAMAEFCRRIIKIVAPIVPVVKINSAFFEQYYGAGVEAYFDLVHEARSKGLLVIGDVKRADVGHSAARYAKAHLADPEMRGVAELMVPDAVTVNPLFGIDGIKPFIETARSDNKGVFVLVQTSNESAREVQGLELAAGGTVAEWIAQMVNGRAGDDGLTGSDGMSCIGAVVSPKDAAAMARFRSLMPNSYFLVPGFGAQGRTAEDIAPAFKSDGSGALVTASRSVIYAYDNTKYMEMYASEWEKCVEHACRDFANEVAAVARS